MGIRDIWDRAVHPQCVVVKKKQGFTDEDKKALLNNASVFCVISAFFAPVGPLMLALTTFVCGFGFSVIQFVETETKKAKNWQRGTCLAISAASIFSMNYMIDLENNGKLFNFPEKKRLVLIEAIQEKAEIEGRDYHPFSFIKSFGWKIIKNQWDLSVAVSPTAEHPKGMVMVEQVISFVDEKQETQTCKSAYPVPVRDDIREKILMKRAATPAGVADINKAKL